MPPDACRVLPECLHGTWQKVIRAWLALRLKEYRAAHPDRPRAGRSGSEAPLHLHAGAGCPGRLGDRITGAPVRAVAPGGRHIRGLRRGERPLRAGGGEPVSEPREVGVRPWFPWPLSRWSWWTENVPAERVAALRIATALVVLFDILFTYLPYFHTLFSPEALGGRDLYAPHFRGDHYYWSVLRVLPDSWGPQAVFAVWIAYAVRPPRAAGGRSSAGCWCGRVRSPVWNTSTSGAHNGGDQLRNSLFLLVAVSCSGAVWGVSSVRRLPRPRHRGRWSCRGWPVKLLFVQLAVMYFASGYYKALSPLWRSGFVMHWASHDLFWSALPGSVGGSYHWRSIRLSAQSSRWCGNSGFPVLAVIRKADAGRHACPRGDLPPRHAADA